MDSTTDNLDITPLQTELKPVDLLGKPKQVAISVDAWDALIMKIKGEKDPETRAAQKAKKYKRIIGKSKKKTTFSSVKVSKTQATKDHGTKKRSSAKQQ